jgi:hypothetical protein
MKIFGAVFFVGALGITLWRLVVTYADNPTWLR